MLCAPNMRMPTQRLQENDRRSKAMLVASDRAERTGARFGFSRAPSRPQRVPTAC
jgi:hypothetical protein